MPRPPGRRVKCHARSKRTKQPCGNWAVTGWQVCRMHGARGGAPPGSMRGNSNALSTGERASVAVAKIMRPYLKDMESPDTPAAMLRNQARRMQARIKFMLWLLLDVEDALELFRMTGEWKGSALMPALTVEGLGGAPLALRRAVRRHKVDSAGPQFEQITLVYQSLFKRWLSLQDAINRIDGALCRTADQLRYLQGPSGSSSLPAEAAQSAIVVQMGPENSAVGVVQRGP